MSTPPEVPATLQEWLWFMKQYEKDIYVREKVNGKWDSVALSDLTPERWAHHVVRMLSENIQPCRIHRG